MAEASNHQGSLVVFKIHTYPEIGLRGQGMGGYSGLYPKVRVSGTWNQKKKLRSTKTIDNEKVEFDNCYGNSVLIEDPSKNNSFRVPSIDDLIRLKKIRKPNAKDEQDIKYLLRAKQLRKKS